MSEKQPCTYRQTRFHRFHGYNLSLHEQDTVAHREMSFANAIVFSEQSLSPGEVFLIEIESSENGWSGHIRLGLTQLDPDALQRSGHLLPQCAIPDMVSNKAMGESWICALTKHQAWYDANYLTNYFRLDGNHVFTSRGTFPTSILKSSGDEKMDILPTDVGSRVGVLYLPCGQNMAVMHFIINGEFVVPLSSTIPYNDGPIRAVIDVYGATKRVRVIQVYNVNSLQSACRETILKNIKAASVSKLPLPNALKEYLLYKT
ncbi:neuralized-like protein 2 [Myzus persicae]|uniref:neuralized-like protein 2 n=1 Tax=Myzus persicae TaxID=13164 RepID=UPI000B931802|nr:neuralized-like protein 2 [Myzus persicae]